MAKNNESPFRSITDLKGYNDDEVNREKSLTDPEQDEPIQKLVARMLRGELVETRQVFYDEIRPETPHGEAFEAQCVMERDGADLADIPAIIGAANDVIAALPPKPVPPPAEQPAAEPSLAPVPADGK